MKNEQDKNVLMAQEVSKILPETNDKVRHYQELLKAEAGLLNALQSRQGKWHVSSLKKIREAVEIVSVKNGILHKQKIYETYVARKKKYEGWLDEMAREVATHFDSVMEDAKEITANPRLVEAIQRWEGEVESPPIQQKVEFYLYLKTEISNSQKGKGKKGNKSRTLRKVGHN